MNIKRYIKITLRLFKLEFMTDLQYRLNFLFTFLSTSSWLIAELMFMNFLLQRYDKIAGWNLYEIGILIGVNQIWVGGAFYLIIWPSLVSFARKIRTGDLDRILTLPINTRFFISVFKIDITSLVILLDGFILTVFCILKLHLVISLTQVLLFIIFLLVSYWIIYCFQFIASTLVFWLTEAGAILYTIHIIDRLSRFPYEIFSKGILLILFTFVLPATIVANIPARALMGILDWKFILYELIAAFWFALVSQILWKIGLKRYESVGN